MYVAQAVKPAKPGASITQTFRISTGMLIMRRKFHIRPDVTIKPGYIVPPTTLPRGYHAVGSNQFQNSCVVRMASGGAIWVYIEPVIDQHLRCSTSLISSATSFHMNPLTS